MKKQKAKKMESKPFHLFKGLLRLVSYDFEKKFYLFNDEFQILSELGWSSDTKKNGLLIDLSKIRWVEMSAAAQLILLIESAKKDGLKITVALPLTRLSKQEAESISKAKGDSDSEFYKKSELFEAFKLSREYAKNYLTTIQFQRAAVCEHIKSGTVSFLENYEFEADHIVENEIELKSGTEILRRVKRPEEIGYKFLIPLTWIKAKEHNHSLDFIEEKFTTVLSQPERGLDSIDALAIKNVIINELLKNVKEHSSCTDALIGMALQPSKILSATDYLSCERDFIEWTTKANNNYITIFFGDTGEGLCRTLTTAYKSANPNESMDDHNIIKWSFDKWSTSKTNELIRGTKGLYRILRIINKYNGLISIRTGHDHAGFQKGGLVSPKFIHQTTEKKKKPSIGFLPGTFLKMQFSPFKELSKFNITPHIAQYRPDENYKWTTKTIRLDTADPKKTFAGDLAVKQIFGEEKTNILILVDSLNSKLQRPDQIEDAIKNHLLHLSEARHPNGVVVYGFPTGWENIESIVNSVNSLIQEKRIKPEIYSEAVHPDKEDIYDPVLVLGENRQFCWVGDDPNIISCLNELYQSEQPKEHITELASYNSFAPKIQTKVLQYFMSDDAVVSLGIGQALRFNFSNLKTHFSEQLKFKLTHTIEQQTDGQKYFVTPNLRNVRYWISIGTLIRDDLKGYAFALSAALKEIHAALPENLNNYKILIDNHDSFQLAVEFSGWIGIPSKNIINFNDEVDGRLPRRNPIFEEKDNVIILTTIISTKETARRSLKAVLRDLASPIAVLGIINQSSDHLISAWGKEIPTVSLINNIDYGVSQEKIKEHNLKPTYKAPFGYIEEYNDAEVNSNKDIEKIYNLITAQKALHFSHLGKANNRHFTFYISATRLLNDEEMSEKLVYGKFYEKIKSWLDDIRETTFDIWRPTPDFKLSNPANKITTKIQEHFAGRRKYQCNNTSEITRAANYGEWTLVNPRAYQLKPCENIVIVDWGSLTGNTTQQMINLAANEGKKNILVCILFSQLNSNDEEFLLNIKVVKGEKRKNSEILFESPQSTEISSAVSVNFLYRLPLRNYESADCPICEHIHALREFEIKGEHMSNFYTKRRERLKIRDKDNADLPPQDFYAKENIYLDSDVILQMFKFRVLLQESLFSTIKRKQIEDSLESILKNITTEKINPKSDIYSILYFLSVEIMWMQKPPLVFLSVRNTLSKIAREIARWSLEEGKKFFLQEATLVRYKFAAISVLRSSDKNEFNRSIFDMFISAKRRDSYSHSITQNLFYHTYSYLKRQYHTKSEYFDIIIENLDLILKENNLSSNLKNVIIFLKYFAEQRKFEIAIPSDSKMTVFSSYKKQIIDNYGLNYKHNNVSDDFTEVKPIDYMQMLQDYHEKELPEETLKSILDNSGFINWISIVPKRWSDVAGYLNNVVINHFAKLGDLVNSKLFTSSDTSFATFIKQMLSEKKLFGVNDDLTLQVNEIITNPSILGSRSFFNNFSNTWNFYYHSFMQVNALAPSLSCPLVKIAEQAPCDYLGAFTKSIAESKRKAANQNIEIEFKSNLTEEIKVFFPYSQLKHFLDQVFLYNLFTHHVNGEVIYVVIEMTSRNDNEITITISSKGTKPKEKNKGGLNKFNTEFTLFGGHLSYDYSESKKQFNIEIRLLIWKDEQ